MVGHTGSINSSIKAISVLDECIKKIVDECMQENIVLLITADHGNIEEIKDKRTGAINKEHSTNPVPFILVGKQFQLANPKKGGIESMASVVPVGVLSDVAPTMLELMGIEKPEAMTGVSLLPQLIKE
jgi:2,3-bisphosphoglycerate-independent phosphoglycerate mutase